MEEVYIGVRSMWEKYITLENSIYVRNVYRTEILK